MHIFSEKIKDGVMLVVKSALVAVLFIPAVVLVLIDLALETIYGCADDDYDDCWRCYRGYR